VPRNNTNFGNRVKLSAIPNHINAKDTVTLKNPELIKEHSERQYLQHTIQVNSETLQRLKDASDLLGNGPTYGELIIELLDHYLNCSQVERKWHYVPPTSLPT